MIRCIKVLSIILLIGACCISCSSPNPSAEIPTPVQISIVSAAPIDTVELLLPVSTPTPQSPSLDFTYADLADIVFVFLGGAGAWQTEVTISSDGSFRGYYSDSDMGDNGSDYPNGTQYVCAFSGKFSSLNKISDFEYSMECESLSQEGTVNEEKIGDDGIRYITSKPYGFDDAGEFRLFLPGMTIYTLPEGFTEWVDVPRDSSAESGGVLSFYGLYNVNGKEGFSG
ncbi:MAG TPA: hypothetical protein PKA81_05630 [Clostridia bacterium]|nr:hypothetical protein [Clostridia bacterium]